MGQKQTQEYYKILSIDGWRDGSSWSWNNWHWVKNFPVELIDKNNRVILAWLRSEGVLSEHSKGRVTIEDDGYNLVIKAKGTLEPLFAIEYGGEIIKK